jgi:hypothetical protein
LDGTRDFNLGRKDFGQAALKKLVFAMGSLLLSHDLQLKIVKTVAIFSFIVKAGGQIQNAAKEATTAFHNAAMAIDKAARRVLIPPFILVVDAILNRAKEAADNMLDDMDRARVAITSYVGLLAELEAENPLKKPQRLLRDWRFARFRTTWNREFAMLEVGLSMTRTQQATNAWDAVHMLLTTKLGFEEKHGIAPKADVVRRLEAALKHHRPKREE